MVPNVNLLSIRKAKDRRDWGRGEMAIIGISKISVPGSNPGVPAFASPKSDLKSDEGGIFIIRPSARRSRPTDRRSRLGFGEVTPAHMKKLHFIKPKLVKPKFFLGILIALISLEIYLGIILGYFLTKFFAKKVPSVAFDIGNWRLHFHHWLIALGILISALYYNFLPFPQFSFGFLGGLVIQGISSYPDWHKILFKKKNN